MYSFWFQKGGRVVILERLILHARKDRCVICSHDGKEAMFVLLCMMSVGLIIVIHVDTIVLVHETRTVWGTLNAQKPVC